MIIAFDSILFAVRQAVGFPFWEIAKSFGKSHSQNGKLLKAKLLGWNFEGLTVVPFPFWNKEAERADSLIWRKLLKMNKLNSCLEHAHFGTVNAIGYVLAFVGISGDVLA